MAAPQLSSNGFLIDDVDDGPIISSPGAVIVLESGENVARLIGSEPDAEFSSPNQDFDLVSGYFAATAFPADLGRLDVTFEGIDDGIVVASFTVENFSSAKTFITFGDAFLSIDKVHIKSVVVDSPSTRVILARGNLNGRPASTLLRRRRRQAPSRLRRRHHSAGRQRDGDGAGNTTLSQGGNTTTLLGVNPDAVTEDWFIIG